MGAISFTQAPGPNNVLGKVKFVYPNPYSVYMHDTIKQGLFDKDMRAEGHNCPRVVNPGKIAAVCWRKIRTCRRPRSISCSPSGYNSRGRHPARVPVHTAYFTAVADEQGKVEIFADIYKLDCAVAAAIIGKGAKPEAVADNAEPKPAKPPKPREATRADLCDSSAAATAACGRLRRRLAVNRRI